MADPRVQKFARTLVDYSTAVRPGERVGIFAGFPAEALVRELYALVLERGAYPHLFIDIPDQEELLFRHAGDELLEYVPRHHKLAVEEFEVLIKIRSQGNTRSLSSVDPGRQLHYQQARSALLEPQMRRGAAGKLRWMSTAFPTQAYAMEANMGFEEYQDFFFRACHCDEHTPDPLAYWQGIEGAQERIVSRLQGGDRVEIRGANADLTLSVKDRIFKNSCGKNNLPDGEIYTGPVEDSVNGWVRYTYPAVYEGHIVTGVELTFKDGQVVKARAAENEDFLLRTLDIDPGARCLGEFAIGNNYEIDRFTGSILFDEKIGGSFHTALGASYPETGGRNHSHIHWDLICDLRGDSEIRLDGERIYCDGQFTF